MELKELVAGFGAKTGLGELSPDDEGTYWLKVDDYVLGLGEDTEARALVIQAPVAERTDENASVLAETLLELNLLYLGTQGGTFALDREAGSYFYQRREALDTMDVERFTALIETVVNLVEEFSNRIPGFLQTCAEAETIAEKKEAEERSLGGLASEFMQV